jgi:hypothetical protein
VTLDDRLLNARLEEDGELLLVVVQGDRPHVVVAAQLDLLLLEPDQVGLAEAGAEPLVQRVDELREQAAGLLGLPAPALTGQPREQKRPVRQPRLMSAWGTFIRQGAVTTRCVSTDVRRASLCRASTATGSPPRRADPVAA